MTYDCKNTIPPSNKFDTYILSTAPWKNPTALNDKLRWVKKYLGDYAYKRLILIDDRTKNGASEFEGEHILFGSEKFPDWASVLEYLMKAEG
jgi:5'-nucleotidase